MTTMLLVITILSLSLAVVTSAIAWRAVRDARRRSNERIAGLARVIDGREDEDPALDALQDDARGTLFGSVRAPEEPSRASFALAAGAVVIGAAVALAIVLSSSESPMASSGTRDAESALAHPLELVALDHERSAAALTVRGVVRNPATGRDRNDLIAVALLLDNAGRPLRTGRAPVHKTSLQPDARTGFAVTFPDDGRTGRYRVSFQIGDRVVPHRDEREDR